MFRDTGSLSSGDHRAIGPVIRTVPAGSSFAICASASASRVRKNGNADSGQIKCVMSVRPVAFALLARPDKAM
jgi:hypothetical protein